MKIQFQCENEKFTPLLAKVKFLTADKGITYCGYEENQGISETDSVCWQMEAVYTAVQEEESLSAGKLEKTIAETEAIFSEEEVLLTPSSESGTVMDSAIYFCALLSQMGLHAVLIFGEKKIAAGVWLYNDYDMEEYEIRTPEFAQEAYDEGGCLLAIDCEYLNRKDSFSHAVKAGCQIVKNFVFAEDIAQRNTDLEEPVVILTEGMEPCQFEDDGSCPYFKDLLQLYMQVAQDEEMAASVMSDEVQHKQWASCFMEGISKADTDPVEYDDAVWHLPWLQMHQRRKTEEICRSPLLLVQTEQAEQMPLTADIILQNIQRKKTTLVLSSEEPWDDIGQIFEDTRLPLFFLSQPQMEDEKLKQKVKEFEAEKPVPIPAKKLVMQRKRYQDSIRKLEVYESKLEQMTGCGKTLKELQNRFQEIKNCPVELKLTREQTKNITTLDMAGRYLKAVKECQLKNPAGEIYLDFSKFTPEQIEELISLLEDCMNPFIELSKRMKALGTALGRERGEYESAKSYMQTMESCADFIQSCQLLKESIGHLEILSQPDKEEIEQKEKYDRYSERNKAKESLQQYWEVESLQLSDQEIENLIQNCETAKKELEQGFMLKNRACQVAIQEIENILSPVAKSDRIFRFLRQNQSIELCRSLQAYFQLEADKGDLQSFQSLETVFGKNIYEDAAQFGLQMKIARMMKDFESQQESSAEFLKNIKKEIQDCIRQTSCHTEDWNVLAEDLLEQLTCYSQAVKKVFRYLEIDYHVFAAEYPDDTMMKFIDNWADLLIEQEVYKSYHEEKMLLLRNHLGSVQEQFAGSQESADVLLTAFEKAWYQVNLEQYQKDFDFTDYMMTCSSCEKLCMQLYINEMHQLENAMLENAHQFDTKILTECETVRDIFLEKGTVLQEYFPVMLMTPGKALTLLKETDIEYDQVVVLDANVIPYYQILYLSTKAKQLTLVSDEQKPEEYSAAWQAEKKKFPVSGTYE